MILDEIKQKLAEIDPCIHYGAVASSQFEMLWDYIVFNRVTLSSAPNKTGYSDYYDVHIVRENFIPEGLDIEVINKMCEISGMRLTSSDAVYSYVQKPNTDTVVEMLTLHFVRARKNV